MPQRALRRAPRATARAASTRRRHAGPPQSSPLPGRKTARPRARPNEMSPKRSRLVLYDEFDPAILCLATLGVIASHRLGAAIADRGEARRGQARFCHVVDDRLRALFGQYLIGRTLAVAIGMPGDLDVGSRTAERNFDQAVEQASRIRIKGGTPGLEPDCSLCEQLGKKLLANRGVDGCSRRLDRNFRLELPALGKVLDQVAADLTRYRVVEGIAGDLHFAVRDHKRAGGQ